MLHLPAQKTQASGSQFPRWPRRRAHFFEAGAPRGPRAAPAAPARPRRAPRTLRAAGREAWGACWCARGAQLRTVGRAAAAGGPGQRHCRTRAQRPAARALQHLCVGFLCRESRQATLRAPAQKPHARASQGPRWARRRALRAGSSTLEEGGPRTRPALPPPRPPPPRPPRAARRQRPAAERLLMCARGAGAQHRAGCSREECPRWRQCPTLRAPPAAPRAAAPPVPPSAPAGSAQRTRQLHVRSPGSQGAHPQPASAPPPGRCPTLPPPTLTLAGSEGGGWRRRAAFAPMD